MSFDKSRIETAIQKAFANVGEYTKECAEHTSKKIADEIANIGRQKISVEEIQNLVEHKLMSSKYKDVAKAYVIFRNMKSMARGQYKELMDAVADKLSANNVENQNANVDERSFGGRVGEASRVVTKQFALEHCMSKMARENHLNNRIYIHDLDSYAVGLHNCLSIPFDDLLKNGFKTRQAFVRPANSVNTAFQLVAVIMQIQSLQQFG